MKLCLMRRCRKLDGRSWAGTFEAVAAIVAAGLAERHLEATQPAAHHFCVTDTGETFTRIARRILQDPGVNLEWVEVV